MEKLLLCLVEIGMKMDQLDEDLRALGYGDTPYWDLSCKVSDALYNFLGEHTGTYQESVTYKALNEPGLTERERTKLLMDVYREKNPRMELPKHTLSVIEESAKERGISNEAMMSTVLSEWALRHEQIRKIVDAIMK